MTITPSSGSSSSRSPSSCTCTPTHSLGGAAGLRVAPSRMGYHAVWNLCCERYNGRPPREGVCRHASPKQLATRPDSPWATAKRHKTRAAPTWSHRTLHSVPHGTVRPGRCGGPSCRHAAPTQAAPMLSAGGAWELCRPQTCRAQSPAARTTRPAATHRDRSNTAAQ